MNAARLLARTMLHTQTKAAVIQLAVVEARLNKRGSRIPFACHAALEMQALTATKAKNHSNVAILQAVAGEMLKSRDIRLLVFS